MTDDLRRYCGRYQYTEESYYGLLAAMSQALAAK